ncbi:MAG: rane protein [Ferruginibacter sp.]|uniref:hybrid sensor histidine kinase/response regulator n=1 Tax=Ferruginibacter sp. TaxID=1940288 RepID=UPI0026586B05|nr:hybrid sensor histidine kinase/response regulator [Ferruginibacter sp.]MDB5276488.1 rane protein [Ferruginibacter sp.]
MPVNKPLKILIIDDDEDDFFITSELIKKIDNGYLFTIDSCSFYKEALDKICKGEYDVYFVDYKLRGQTGLELIHEAIKNGCEEPLILLTGIGNREIDVLAMQAGAVDYLVKSELTTEKLERCIRYALERFTYLKALRANEQKFRNFFENSRDGVFMADEQLMFKDVNHAASLLCGYTKEEMLHLSIYDLLADEENQHLIEKELAAAGELSDKELDLYTKNRERINCIVSVTREKDGKGNLYMQGIIHDITSLKKAEKITLQTEKLKSTQRFVRILAHEVRNPLNNIYLSSDQLTSLIQAEEPAFLLDIITRNSKRIGNLITELLNSARPAEIILDKICLRSVIEESINSASDRIMLKNIRLERNYTMDSLWIMGDFEKLKLGFVNIIINAIEAMKDNEGKLTIGIKNDNANYVVTINDNGSGISEENITKLFEPYFTSKSNGMGLGLAATLNIFQSHSALIEVQSKINHGTSFIINIKKMSV